MKLIHTKEIVIETALTVNEGLNKLSAIVEPKKFSLFIWPFERKPFRGSIENNKFNLMCTSLVKSSLKIRGVYWTPIMVQALKVC